MSGGSVLLVCTGCRAPGTDPSAPRPGAALLAAVRAAAPAHGGPRIEGVTCLSGCKRHCAAALSAPGRVTYMFGDLVPDASTASALLEAAAAHATVADGWLPRAERPACLRTNIIARVPPLHWSPSADGGPIVWPG